VKPDRSGAPATDGAVRGADPVRPAYDVDLPHDEPWLTPSIADAIALSPRAAKRLAEQARTRAVVMPELEDARCSIDAGSGTSIVLDSGLYRAARTP
jgi:hypothetical protein